MNKKIIHIIIPTYNEKENLAPLLDKINLLHKSIQNDYLLKVLFIDDNSPDQTTKGIDKLKSVFRFEIKYIKRAGKLGLGTAYIAGFKQAIEEKSDIIFQMDADLSHDPLTIREMLKSLKLTDFVIGSRYIKGGKLPKWSIDRKLISAGGNLYARIILGLGIRDYTGGFNGYKREVLEAIDLDQIRSNGYSFQIEMKQRAKSKGFRYTEIPIHFHDRTYGKSKFSGNIFKEALINTWKLRKT